MPRYRICETAVQELSPDDVRAEAGELRIHMTRARNDLSTRQAWALAEGRQDDRDHLKWVANARTFLSKLESRYAEVRESERALNREERNGRH